MTTAFYVIKTYQSVFERRMRTLQFRSPGIAPGNADESAPDGASSASPPDMASIFVIFSKDCSFLVLLASLLFHRCVMPRAHDDCKFRDEWLVQDKYKEWVVKDGDPRLARCQFCMKSSKFHHPWTTMACLVHGHGHA